jgi:hypothetical protein
MKSIKRLLEKNPDILRTDSLDLNKKRERRHRYEKGLRYDKVEELAREFISLGAKIPSWKIDSSTIEKIFNLGKNASREYGVNLLEIEKLFNDVFPKCMRGGLLGFFISGLYKDVIREQDVLILEIRKYPASISGLGYRHSCGRLEIIGNKAYYVGIEMEGGEMIIRGSVGNHLGKAMKGGRIIIEGDARNWVGEKMENGLILIEGNAGHIVGKKMTGGEIVIRGDVGYWVGDEAEGGMIRIKDAESYI